MQEIIWFWKRGFYKVYVDDYKLKEKINGWKEAKVHCHYYYPNGKKAWDIIFPSKYYNRIARELALPSRSKNDNRIKAGKMVHKVNFYPRQPKVKSSNLACKGRKNESVCLATVN